MKRLFALLLAGCLLLYACGLPENLSQPAETTAPETTAPETTPTEAPTAPTEPVKLYRHPITGEALDEPFSQRCVAVVINNIRQAQPLYGIAQADILYEIMAEGGGSITRCLAVYSDLSGVEKIGSIRSARTYLVDLARAHNAVFIHCGGSDYSLDELKELQYDAINEYSNGSYFFRDEERYASGYAWEHTLFSSGQKILSCIQRKGFSMQDVPASAPAFAMDATPDGEDASTIEVRFNSGGKATILTYNPQSGCYYGEQRWRDGTEYSYVSPLADEATQELVAYRNVLVLYVKTTTDGYRMFTEQTGSGDGYYACGGKIVPIQWHRQTLDDPFTYTLPDGTALTQGIGKTYAAVLPIGSPTEYR